MTKTRDEEVDKEVETRAEMEERHRQISKHSDPITGRPLREAPDSVLWERIYDRLNSVNASYSRSREEIRSPEVPALEYPLSKVIGETSLRRYHRPGQNSNLTENLNAREATRLYLYFDLSPLNISDVARNTTDKNFRESLRVSNKVSQPTLGRMPGRMNEKVRHEYASEAETLVRQLQGGRYESWVRDPTPDTIVSDGEGFPPAQVIGRELREKTFKYIRLNRDDSIEVTKDAALRALIAAANGNKFANQAAESLKYKGFYDEGDILTGQNLTFHLRKSSRESVFQMFREANEVLFEIADEHDYFSENEEVAFDITDWPFYGDSDSDEYIRGTKPGRNYSYAWKYITLALVGTDTPLILAVLPVKDKSNTPEYVRRMLRLSQQYIDIGRVYMDAGIEFYNSDTISVIEEHGLELIMQGRKSGDAIKHLLNGMARTGLRSSYYPYGVGDLDGNNYYAIGLKSDKTTKRRKEEADEPMDNYTYFYTNIDPAKLSPEEMGEAYRRRWGIETDFRKIKNDFLAQCGSKDPALRAFYFNFAGHLFNIWTVANILRAEENGENLADGKQTPAPGLMDAIEDDPHDLQISTEPPETRQIFGDVLNGGWSV